MSIEIEMRGVRWRSVGRRLNVESAADRRLHVGQAFLSAAPEPTLRPVLPKRFVGRQDAGAGADAAGGGAPNLRAENSKELRNPHPGLGLVAKD
jgi:hypothetical protein